MEERKNTKADLPHNIIMENRTKITVSGVENAESYNENEIILHTSEGVLVIKGNGLNLSKLNLDSGEITVGGKMSVLEYVEPAKPGGSFFGRLFK